MVLRIENFCIPWQIMNFYWLPKTINFILGRNFSLTQKNLNIFFFFTFNLFKFQLHLNKHFFYYYFIFPPTIIPSRRSMLNWNFNKFWIEHSLVVCSVLLFFFYFCAENGIKKNSLYRLLWTCRCRCNSERKCVSLFISHIWGEFSYIFSSEIVWRIYNLNKMVIWESKNTGTVFLWQTIYKLFCFIFQFFFLKLYLNE